jgi:hypothetical protein
MQITVTALHAQDTLSVKQQATKPYKLALGARFSTMGPLGADLALSAKYFIGKESALEVQTTAIPGSNFYQASLSYIWQPQLLSSSQFRPYAGLGAGIMRTKYDFSPEEEKRYVKAAAIGVIGIEYQLKKLPLALSFDYRMELLGYYLKNNVTTPGLSTSYPSNIGIGVKYIIK